jgi:glycosyltransferase involved in cell wall biosynthesis
VQDNLSDCLDSAKASVDEIIIVDFGSIVKTKEIAAKYTDKVFDCQWDNDISKVMNFSISKASKQWIFVLDACEVMNIADMGTIRLLLEDSDADALSLIQRNYCDDAATQGWTKIIEPRGHESRNFRGFINYPVTRIFKNFRDIKFSGSESASVDDSINALSLRKMHVDLPVHHYSIEVKNDSKIALQMEKLRSLEKRLIEKPSGRSYYEAGTLRMQYFNDFRIALGYFESALKKGYKEVNCLEAIAQCHVGLKEDEKAYEVYKTLIKKKHISSAMANNLANLLVMHKHYRPAIRYLKLALELGNPNKERIIKNIKALEALLSK